MIAVCPFVKRLVFVALVVLAPLACSFGGNDRFTTEQAGTSVSPVLTRSSVDSRITATSPSVPQSANAAFYTPQPPLVDGITSTARFDLPLRSLRPGQAQTYRGITPGVSRKEDVLRQWGGANVIRRHGDLESLHYFHNLRSGAIEFVMVKDDVVLAITSNVVDLAGERYPPDQGAPTAKLVSDLTRVLGPAVLVTPTLTQSPVWLFQRGGLALELDDWRFRFFAPMPVEEYRAYFGDVAFEFDPFPVIPSIETAGIQPGQTTRVQVGERLGTPDYIAYRDASRHWIYFMEPELLGRLTIFFDADGVVSEAGIDEPMWKPDTLETVVSRYGPPQLVQLVPGEDGEKYASLRLIYIDRAMAVKTSCWTRACTTIRRQEVIGTKWYFRPMTIDEFKAASPSDAAYIEWHGFDE